MDEEMDTKIIYPNERSPTPELEEEFDQDKDWAYEIVAEEVGYKDTIRHEIRWKEWKSKKDGANNTWNEADIPTEAIAAYDRAQTQKRKEKAKESSDIPIYGGRDIMNIRTIMRAEAYQEKLQRYKFDDDDDLASQLRELDEAGSARAPDSSESDAELPRPPPRPARSSQTASSSKASSSTSSRATTSFSKATSSSSSRATTMSTSSLKRKAIPSPTPSGSQSRGRPLTKKTPSRPMLSSSPSDDERIPPRSAKRPRRLTESPSPPPIRPTASMSKSTPTLPHRRPTASSSLFLQAPVASSSKVTLDSHPPRTPRARPPAKPVEVIDLVSDDEVLEILEPPPIVVRQPSVTVRVKEEPVMEEFSIDISSDDDKQHRLEDEDEDDELSLDREPVETRAIILGRIWTSKAEKAGAACITFVNEIDDEEVPEDLPRDFDYIENHYIYSKGITHPNKHPKDVWLHCTHKVCKRPEQCDCQPEGETWEIYQKRPITGEPTSKRAFAYDNSKNFAFLFDSKLTSKCVVECNKYCACDMSCPNRIAQRPRQIPIEIFKTKRCGWGARSTVSVNRGNVLGVYTGELLNRQAAKRIKSPNYVFDLDWLDNVDDDDDADDAYSVESFKCGNWTRFMNHSCDPNVGVYMVSYDSLPDMNTPYIAFTALKRIRAGEEFTFDYQPRTPKGAVMERPKGARQCRCGTKKCCGWL